VPVTEVRRVERCRGDIRTGQTAPDGDEQSARTNGQGSSRGPWRCRGSRGGGEEPPVGLSGVLEIVHPVCDQLLRKRWVHDHEEILRDLFDIFKNIAI
jgi:hypothetical protein